MPLQNFHLAALFEESPELIPRRFLLGRELQDSLKNQWHEQLEAFRNVSRLIDFNPGYSLESDELFKIDEFQPPEWLASRTSLTAEELASVAGHEDKFKHLVCLLAFARTAQREEIVLFQNFVSSHLIQPGRLIFRSRETYETNSRPSLALDKKLSAVYFPSNRQLLFKNFRAANTFLPLADYFSESSGEEIRQILSHRILTPETTASVDALAADPPQWFRKRFAMLRASRLLDNYTAREIQASSSGYDITIQVERDNIIFPADRDAAKKLLQFLNEEIYRGAITKKLYETNSKRETGE